MPMTVAYTNFGGQLIHENRGGTESFYTADPLGSIVDVRNSSGTQTFSATYWPYGEIRTSTGTNPSPFDFVGSLGYYRENSARTYVRARFLRKELARWMNVDPLWPDEQAYGYGGQCPAMNVDPSGLWWVGFVNCTKAQEEFLVGIFNGIMNPGNLGSPDDIYGNTYLGCLECLVGRTNLGGLGGIIDDWRRNQGPEVSFIINCSCKLCDKNTCSYANPLTRPATICLCPKSFVKPSQGGGCGLMRCILAHEIIHAAGSFHSGSQQPAYECVQKIRGCESYSAMHTGGKGHK